MSTVRGPVLSLLVFGAVALGGCGVVLAPVHDVPTTPVVSASSRSLDRDDVRAALIRALTAKGWQVLEDDATHLTARVTVGGHWATVDLAYSESSYAIQYRASSPSLKHDGHEIHRRYNHWIRLLNQRIAAELAKTQPHAPAAAAP